MIKRTIKMLFCKHTYEKIGFIEKEDNSIRYSLRHFRCSKCGKEKWVDGRKE